MITYQFILNNDDNIWPWSADWPTLPWSEDLQNLKAGDIVELDWKPKTFTVRVKKEFRVIAVATAYNDLDCWDADVTIEVESADSLKPLPV